MLISGFAVVGWAFGSLVSFSSLDFQNGLPVLVAFSISIFMWNSCWCWKLGEGAARGSICVGSTGGVDSGEMR